MHMRAKLRHLAANLALLVGSLLACLLCLEFVVFGIFLKPDDVLATLMGAKLWSPSMPRAGIPPSRTMP
jgi:hypothetical protein